MRLQPMPAEQGTVKKMSQKLVVANVCLRLLSVSDTGLDPLPAESAASTASTASTGHAAVLRRHSSDGGVVAAGAAGAARAARAAAAWAVGSGS